ncbi:MULTISPECIES: TetR/AcrR family transcriptional regulator [unclassified Psychrobacter]|uniref:TetR/AcrR family transcriptional regulator n=1 Tax=unclassified Psychrobacter TaxID=196806 RepID=UPI0009A5BD3F|nr:MULTISPECIES: TetR/AcrR family transcriptional regulator [unclassified Psychrobacter]OXL27042.1 TetR family transcriptional regulator [Psychrobacter sp. DAB_AL32B]SLJ85383.1 transcriptional regulator, TetR family [Psychrobacter sp. DAB_AL43B]
MTQNCKENPPTSSENTVHRNQQDIRAQNQAVILIAAEEEFVLQSYRGATMQGIADRAGLPKANIHYYFKNKKNLYKVVLRSIIQEWNEGLVTMTVDSDPKTVIEKFVRTKLHQAFANPNRHKLFALEVIGGAPHLHDFMSTVMKDWALDKTQVMKTWHEQGRIAIADPLQLLILIWATTQRYAEFETEIVGLMQKEAYDEQDEARAADFLVPFILRGCGIE